MEMTVHLHFVSRIIMVIMIIMAITGYGHSLSQNQDFLSIGPQTVLLSFVRVAVGVLSWWFSGGSCCRRDEDFVPCTVDAVSAEVREGSWIKFYSLRLGFMSMTASHGRSLT